MKPLFDEPEFWKVCGEQIDQDIVIRHINKIILASNRKILERVRKEPLISDVPKGLTYTRGYDDCADEVNIKIDSILAELKKIEEEGK